MSFLQKIKEVKKQQEHNIKKQLVFHAEAISKRAQFSEYIKKKDEIAIIAEIKRASPSAGMLNQNLNVSAMVKAYEAGGASAISVITEDTFFHGSYADLEEAKLSTSLPVLAKDFILYHDQIVMSYYSGADAILLIMKLLDDVLYRQLYNSALLCGLEVVTEVNNKEEIDRALAMPVNIIGVNRRNLETLEVDKNKAEELVPFLPSGVIKIAESGISDSDEIDKLKDLGYDACLIGGSIVQSNNPEIFIKGLLKTGPRM